MAGNDEPQARSRGRRRLVAVAAVAVVAAVALTVLVANGSRSSAPDGAAPNVLLIISDDQRDDAMKVMDATRRLFAADGRTFRRAVVTSPVCCPSRASIMSGQHVHNHGIRGGRYSPEFDEDATIQATLKAAGYHTGHYGKFLNGWPADRELASFDDQVIGYGPAGGPTGTGARRSLADDWIGRRAREYIAAREDDDRRPWLLVLSARSPHHPLETARRYRGARVPTFEPRPAFDEPDLRDKPALTVKYAQVARKGAAGKGGLEGHVRQIHREQQRLLMSLDDMVETTFRALDEHGESERTLAIYVSDNGFFLGEHGLVQKPLPYRETLDVPLLIRWPGEVAAGTRDDRLAANIDIAPTIYDAAGVDPAYTPDGRSLLERWERRWMLIERWIRGVLIRGLYDPGRMKYMRMTEDGKLIGREYYDLRHDPDELENGAGDQRYRTAERRAARTLRDLRDCAASSCP